MFKGLVLVMLCALFGATSAFADGTALWRCAPQPRLNGMHVIRISKTHAGFQAETSYMREVLAQLLPEKHTIDVKETPIKKGLEYSGDQFRFELYPKKKPKHNTVLDPRAVAARVIEVRFSQSEEPLKNTDYACAPVTGAEE